MKNRNRGRDEGRKGKSAYALTASKQQERSPRVRLSFFLLDRKNETFFLSRDRCWGETFSPPLPFRLLLADDEYMKTSTRRMPGGSRDFFSRLSR